MRLAPKWGVSCGVLPLATAPLAQDSCLRLKPIAHFAIRGVAFALPNCIGAGLALGVKGAERLRAGGVQVTPG